MIVKVEHDGVFLPKEILKSVKEIVYESLNGIQTQDGRFIVNDTMFFRKQRTGKITNCVMNSATFISKSFQENLSLIAGCHGETNIDGQKIDGFITRKFEGVGYKVKNKNDLLKILHSYIEEKGLDEQSVYTLFPMFYGMYVDRGMYDIRAIPESLHSYFVEKKFSTDFKIGVEFETGNVASSFRALNKLFVLFQKKEIDAGVFVTSIDKSSSATRIWPVSNRNGSFQELRQRQYMEQVSLPLVCMGFAPDGFDSNAPFLGKNRELYVPEVTDRVDEKLGYRYYLGEDKEEILKPLYSK